MDEIENPGAVDAHGASEVVSADASDSTIIDESRQGGGGPNPTIRSDADYVTILVTAGHANKIVTRSKSGEVTKKPGPPISDAVAVTVRVSDPDAMAELLNQIGTQENQVLCLGFVPGTEPNADALVGEPFKIVSKKVMGKALGVDPEEPSGAKAVLGWHTVNGEQAICRLKANMRPSSWTLFDIDATEGMSEELARLDGAGRRAKLAEIIPGFDECALVVLPSTTGRVLVDGVPMDATGEHLFAQIENPYDLERFGAMLLQHSILKGQGFKKPIRSKATGEQIGSTNWAIADPTTFTHGRLSYDGAPTVRGEGLSVGETVVKIIEGGRLDTSRVLDLSEEEARELSAKTGQTVHRESRLASVMTADGIVTRQVDKFVTVSNTELRPDTVVVTKSGEVTIMDYWAGEAGHTRCQTPFRDSTSWNGILNRHRDGTPFVYDNGTRVRYVMPEALVRKHRADIYMSRLARLSPEEIRGCWTDGLRWQEPQERVQVRQRVAKLTDTSAKELSAELKSAEARWKSDRVKSANAALKVKIKDSGKAIVRVVTDISRVASQTEKVLLTDTTGEPIMSHGNRLVSVRVQKPTTIREVRRERDTPPEDSPLAMMVDPFEFYGLLERISQCVVFLKQYGASLVEVPPPGAVVRAMLEQSHKRAPALVGIIEHPVMSQGELLVADGLSNDGLFVRIARNLIPTLRDEITQEMVQDALHWISEVALEGFPFATDIDKAGAVAALLTAIQRRMFDSNEGCPGFLTTAPIQSSGKTAFFQLLFELVWGRTAAATNWSSSDEELGKHILAILLEGHGGVLFDNLEEGSQVESNVLARAMTSPKFSGRVLGENREATVPTNCLWGFTGNNISASGDFNTRIIPISIDPRMEHPDQRRFSRPDLAEWCESHRAEFYVHAMTIMIGYQRYLCAGGGPPGVKPTRYTMWDDQVRHAMIWAGSADPAVLFEQNKAADPKQEGRKNFLAAWWDIFGDEPQLLRTAITELSHNHQLSDAEEALRDLLPKGVITSKNLSAVLRKFAGQWIGGFRISMEKTDSKSRVAKRWYMEHEE
jgi:hypothetical protein